MFEHLNGRKLYRSPKDAVLFGVAAGLASYLRVDVVFVRLLFFALAILTHWLGFLVVYAIAVILMPIDPAQDTVASTQEPKDVTPVSSDERMDSSQNM
jgi:phage shock protein PspC (stress-responsive transcriptional regulator)